MKSCKTCRWVIGTLLECEPTQKPLIIQSKLICIPDMIEPSQIALSVCDSWQRDSGADSYAEIYGLEEDLH